MNLIIESCEKVGHYKNSRMFLHSTGLERFPWIIEHKGSEPELYETLGEAAYDFQALVEHYGD